MISCTEFIPSYSELFTYLEKHYGRSEVDNFWEYLFKPTGDGIPLINFVKKEGMRGCFTYWKGTLSEEAADVTIYLNEKAGWFYCLMHKCPSKGRLLKLKDEIGIEPYHDYCLHCDHYRAAVEKVGLTYTYNFAGVDHASCSMVISDPKVFDGRIIVDENTEVLEIRAADHEYFHPDFHSSLNMGVDYVGEKYGKDVLIDYLTTYTKNVYTPVFAAIKKDGLAAIEAKILDTYEKEKARDAVKTELKDDTLTVTVAYCPAVKHLISSGRKMSRWYSYTTESVMSVLAEAAGYKFELLAYDEATGAAKYRFFK